MAKHGHTGMFTRISTAPPVMFLVMLLVLSLTSAGGCGDDGDGAPAAGAGAPAPGPGPAGDGDSGSGDGDTGDGDTGDGDTGDGDTGGAYAYSACTVEGRVGGFEAYLEQPVGQAPYTVIQGAVEDGVVPSYVPRTLMTAGDCALVEGQSFFCDPQCGTDTTCNADGQCVPFPSRKDMGTVTIAGVKEGPVVMMARAGRLNYMATGSLPYPGFDEGAAITLEGTGAEGPALSLRAEGVAPLQINEPEVAVASGSATTMTWPPPAEAGKAHVLATLNISLHGGDPVRIECDTADDGSLEIPEELITALLSYNYSGFPAVDVTRLTADSMEGPDGCIDFRVGSRVSRHPVAIEGQTSCTEQEPDCPDGQTCNLDILACE